MSNNEHQDKFISLADEGEKLREELLNLKNKPISENAVETRADLLRRERLRELIDENLKELQFTYYQTKAEAMKCR